MLNEAGIDTDECRLTNVFKHRPPDNKLDLWCVSKKDLPAGYDFEPISLGKYVAPQYLVAVEELKHELGGYSPNLIILAGGTSLWALGLGSISKSRGVVAQVLLPGQRVVKCLPIYHPSAVLRQWNLRTITVTDLIKAKHEAEFPELRRPERCLWIEPTLSEVQEFFSEYLAPAREVSLDIETRGRVITCLALAPSEKLALCIPLTDPRKPNNCYWTHEEERVVWKLLRDLLQTRVRARTLKTVGQNLIYDVQYLAEHMRLFIPRIDEDTMLMHHALHPEMNKGLGFLASIYTNELSWKQMVKDLGRDK